MKIRVSATNDFFKSMNIRLLVTDREGRFAILVGGACNKNVIQVAENSEAVEEVDPQKDRNTVMKSCCNMHLD